MILNKKTIILVLILFFFSNFSYSKINLQIVMKINEQIITTYDLEKEGNYLLALNPKLNEIDKNDLLKLAKRSIVKEIIRKSEILKYKEINLENDQINIVLKNIIQNLNFSNQSQFENYLNNFNISINDLREKIGIENEWKNLVYSKYSTSIKIDKENLINKIDKSSKKEFFIEYDLSEIVFIKKQNISLEDQSKEIFESIQINGFENTANLYSITDSSKTGGKIGWVKKDNLSIEINRELQDLKINSHSNPIKIGNNYLILKINDIREKTVEFDKQKELDRMIMSETSKQLDKFSNIFYNKIKLNSTISEF
ncbi:peptidylprolyl isomerase [Candidatus Pelagibacter sp.]|nr:peptidylprolyl isomerase [Candidatus Pelagibacter sp.]